MSKRAISVTLDADNITWLKGRAGAGGAKSVSALLDQIVTAARAAGRVGPSRSVLGTIDIDPGDPDLRTADAAIRELFHASLGRPLVRRSASAALRAGRSSLRGKTRG